MRRVAHIGPLVRCAVTLTVATAPAATAGAQQTVAVVVTGRVVDRADRVPLVGVVVELDSLRGPDTFARTDSAGRFVLRGNVPSGTTTISVQNGFYRPFRQALAVAAAGRVDAGTLELERGPEPLEYMVMPSCERVTRRPRRLVAGTWIEPGPDSAGRRTWRLCDGLLREPRVAPTR